MKVMDFLNFLEIENVEGSEMMEVECGKVRSGMVVYPHLMVNNDNCQIDYFF